MLGIRSSVHVQRVAEVGPVQVPVQDQVQRVRAFGPETGPRLVGAIEIQMDYLLVIPKKLTDAGFSFKDKDLHDVLSDMVGRT